MLRSFRETPLESISTKQLPHLLLTVPGDGFLDSSFQSSEFGTRDSFERIKTTTTQNDIFKEKFASYGNVIISSLDSYPKHISWRLVKNDEVLELNPLRLINPTDQDLTQIDNNNYSLQSIHIKLFEKVAPKCIVVSETTDSSIVIDLITISGIFVTLKIPTEKFLITSKPSLKNLKLSKWCKIQIPYGFNVRQPHLMFEISTNNLGIALKDGGLIRLSRLRTLDEASPIVFSDNSYFRSLTKVLHWGSKDKVPTHHDVSITTIISVVPYHEASLLFTLSINRVLKIWSLETFSVIAEHELNPNDVGSHTQSKVLLDVHPTKLLTLLPTSSSDASSSSLALTKERSLFLAAYLPGGSGCFKIYRIDNIHTCHLKHGLPIHLEDLGKQMEFIPNAPDNHSVWLVFDFAVVKQQFSLKLESSSLLSLWVLWKSNTSCSVQQLLIQDPKSLSSSSLNTSLSSRIWSIAEPSFEPPSMDAVRKSASTSESESDVYISRILQSHRYSRLSIEIALKIFQQHILIPDDEDYENDDSNSISHQFTDELLDLSLQEKVCKTIGAAVNVQTSSLPILTGSSTVSDYSLYSYDILLQWQKFEQLCSEVEKQSNEAIGMGIDTKSNTVWISKAYSLSFFRPSLDIEMFSFNSSKNPSDALLDQLSLCMMKPITSTSILKNVLQFVDAAKTFRKSLSHAVISDIKSGLEEDYSKNPSYALQERIVTIYEETLYKNYSNASQKALSNVLLQIDLVEVLEALFESMVKSNKLSSKGSFNLSDDGLSLVSNSISQILHTSCEVIFDAIIVILLISSNLGSDAFNTESSKYYSRFLTIYRVYNSGLSASKKLDNWKRGKLEDELATQVRRLTVSSDDNPHFTREISSTTRTTKTSDLVFSPLDAWILKNFHSDIRFGINFSHFTSQLSACLTNKIYVTDFVPFIISRLINEKKTDDALKFLPYIVFTNSPFNIFIRGYLFIKTSQINKAVSLFKRSAYDISTHALTSSEEEILRNLNSDSSYLFNTSISNYYLATAKLFSIENCFGAAIKLTETSLLNAYDEVTKLDVSLVKFENSLKLSDFETCYESLLILQKLGDDKFTELLDLFITKLYDIGEIDRLLSYPFIGLFETIDELLEKKASNEDNSGGDDRYYKVLFSWRLAHDDYRGAATALYIYLTKLRENISSSLKPQSNDIIITDYYMTILNVLACLPEGDSWIVVTTKQIDSKNRIKSGETEDNREQNGDLKRFKSETLVHTVALSYDDVKREHEEWLCRLERILGLEIARLTSGSNSI